MSIFDPLSIFEPTPEERERQAILDSLSQYDHALHVVNFGNDPYELDDEETEDLKDGAANARNVHVGLDGGANTFSSALVVIDDDYPPVQRTGQHTIALDLDFSCQVVSGGGTTVIGLDFVQGGVWDGIDLHPLIHALYVLGVGSQFSLTPRGLVFETPDYATWVPSSTPGHGHLYIDTILWWDEYEALLQAFAWSGLLEPGYAGASIRRRATHLRLPWVKKHEPGESVPF